AAQAPELRGAGVLSQRLLQQRENLGRSFVPAVKEVGDRQDVLFFTAHDHLGAFTIAYDVEREVVAGEARRAARSRSVLEDREVAVGDLEDQRRARGAERAAVAVLRPAARLAFLRGEQLLPDRRVPLGPERRVLRLGE